MQMKRTIRSLFGMTLLEIMLVLGMASMIIVMSLRYYHSAIIAEQTTEVMNQVFAIIAAMESLGATGTYAGIGITDIANYLGDSRPIKTVTGGEIEVVPTNAPNTSFSVAMGLSPSICANAAFRIKSNKITSASCGGMNNTTLTFIFDKTK